MTDDRRALNQPKHSSTHKNCNYAKGLSWLILCSVFGLNTACANNETQPNHTLADGISLPTSTPVSNQTTMPVTAREPTKEQLLESLRKLQSEENPDMATMQMLLERLQSLYDTEYDFSEVDDEETRIFKTMQVNALSKEATGRELYYYSLIIREPRARELLDLSLTQSQADKLADELQAKAVAEGDLSALTKTGYDHIVQAIGKPVFSTEKIGRYYRPYYDVSVKDYQVLSTGLNKLASALKSQCLVDYYPSLDYPFYYHHVYRESGEITMNRNRPIGENLNEFSRNEVAEYPDIEDQLDIIYLRNYMYCYQREYVLNELSSYLTDQTDGVAARDYSIPDVKDRDPMRHRVVLSVLAELLDKKELVPVFAYPLNEVNREEFNIQRERLLNKYRSIYANSVPVDMDIE